MTWPQRRSAPSLPAVEALHRRFRTRTTEGSGFVPAPEGGGAQASGTRPWVRLPGGPAAPAPRGPRTPAYRRLTRPPSSSPAPGRPTARRPRAVTRCRRVRVGELGLDPPSHHHPSARGPTRTQHERPGHLVPSAQDHTRSQRTRPLAAPGAWRALGQRSPGNPLVTPGQIRLTLDIRPPFLADVATSSAFEGQPGGCPRPP